MRQVRLAGRCRVITCVPTLVSVVFVYDALGVGSVWFQATNCSGVHVITQGSAGVGLELQVTAESAGCDIDVYYQTYDPGALGWGIVLGSPDAGIAASNQLFPPGPLNGTTVLYGSLSSSPGVIIGYMFGDIPWGGAGGVCASPPWNCQPSPTLNHLYRFRLSISDSDPCTRRIFAAIGDVEYGGNDDPKYLVYEVVQIGPNPFRPGYAIGEYEPNPVITIYGSAQMDKADPNTNSVRPQILGIEPLNADTLVADLAIITGATADGVTPILLRIISCQPGLVDLVLSTTGANTEMGRLSSVAGYIPSWYSNGGQDVEGLNGIPTTPLADGRHAAFAVYTAPRNFSRSPADHNLDFREISIETTIHFENPKMQDATLSKVLQLRRPPTVLAHGLWSDPGTWEFPLAINPALTSRYGVSFVDYRDTAASSFSQNLGKVRGDIETAIRNKRNTGIACTQCDYIGHSMGGILGRLYAAESTYVGADNLYQGTIHKLITVDTPHAGSPMACLLADENGNANPIGWAFNAGGYNVTKGAVRDLRPDVLGATSHGIPEVSIPAHAIYGTGWTDFFDLSLPRMRYLRRLSKTLTVLGIAHATAFGFEPNDGVVGQSSQWGLLSGAHSSQFNFSDGIHLLNTSSTGISQRVVELLNAPADAGGLFAGGWPEIVPSDTCYTPPNFATTTGGLLLRMIARGAVVFPGEEIELSVEGVSQYTPLRILLLSRDDDQIALGPNAAFTVRVPLEAIGIFRLSAMGIDDNNNVATSNEIELPVFIDATMLGISATPESLSLYSFSRTASIQVLGHYSDSVDREVTGANLGTTYESSNPGVAIVGPGGAITGIGAGSAVITASNQSFSDSMQVTVLCIEDGTGDINGDGLLNGIDIQAFVRAVVGGDTNSLDYCASDINYDGSVDSQDAQQLVDMLINR